MIKVTGRGRPFWKDICQGELKKRGLWNFITIHLSYFKEIEVLQNIKLCCISLRLLHLYNIVCSKWWTIIKNVYCITSTRNKNTKKTSMHPVYHMTFYRNVWSYIFGITVTLFWLLVKIREKKCFMVEFLFYHFRIGTTVFHKSLKKYFSYVHN